MGKEVIDLTSSPRSSKSKKALKSKTSASSEKTQFKNEKCAECSNPPKPTLNYNTKDHFGQTYRFPKAFQAQGDVAATVPTVVCLNTSLLQQGLNLLEHLIPKEYALVSFNLVYNNFPGHFKWGTLHTTCQPPQYESYAPNFINSQLSAACLYYYSTSVTVTTDSCYPNYLVKKNISPPKSLKLFPVANNVDKSTSAFKGLQKKKKRGNASALTMASSAEIDLELRL